MPGDKLSCTLYVVSLCQHSWLINHHTSCLRERKDFSSKLNYSLSIIRLFFEISTGKASPSDDFTIKEWFLKEIRFLFCCPQQYHWCWFKGWRVSILQVTLHRQGKNYVWNLCDGMVQFYWSQFAVHEFNVFILLDPSGCSCFKSSQST